MKISIVMPTYNDESTIIETIESVVRQTYKNWELIIVNDGSTDNVEEVITKYRQSSEYSENIKYYSQENQDQLNAISNAIPYISGDYVFILHSDDLLPENYFLEKITNVALENLDVDVFIGDLTTIDEKSNINGEQKVAEYNSSKKTLPTLLLWLGRNLYVDVIFAKKEVFKNDIYDSYLTWNMPFWTKLGNKAEMLNVKNVDFSMLKYRVHQGNYINNELGKLNVINGELRTVTRLMKYYSIPFYKLQFYIYRIFNKLKLSDIFYPIYLNKEEKNKSSIVQFVIQKRFNNDYIENQFLNGLVEFYKNYTEREIYIDEVNEEEIIYKGKDMRLFNKNLINNNLSPLYNYLIKEMEIGFDEIVVKDKSDMKKIVDITKFLCIYPYVKVTIKD